MARGSGAHSQIAMVILARLRFNVVRALISGVVDSALLSRNATDRSLRPIYNRE